MLSAVVGKFRTTGAGHANDPGVGWIKTFIDGGGRLKAVPSVSPERIPKSDADNEMHYLVTWTRIENGRRSGIENEKKRWHHVLLEKFFSLRRANVPMMC